MPLEPERCRSEQPELWISGSEPNSECPARLIPQLTWLFRIWIWAEKGQLPKPGGSLDQPAWLMDALGLISSAVIDHTEPQREST